MSVYARVHFSCIVRQLYEMYSMLPTLCYYCLPTRTLIYSISPHARTIHVRVHLQFFFKLGVFLCTTIFVSWLYSNFLFTSLTAEFGPEDHKFYVTWVRPLFTCQRRGRKDRVSSSSTRKNTGITRAEEVSSSGEARTAVSSTQESRACVANRVHEGSGSNVAARCQSEVENGSAAGVELPVVCVCLSNVCVFE